MRGLPLVAGTPTFLNIAELEELFGIVTDLYGVEPGANSRFCGNVAAHGGTGEIDMAARTGRGSYQHGRTEFLEPEVNASGRAQKTAWVEDALEHIREAGFPTLNIDLIYGLPHQTVGSWLCSLEMALRWQPEELFLYPLYVRPLTGLGRKAQKVAKFKTVGKQVQPQGAKFRRFSMTLH